MPASSEKQKVELVTHCCDCGAEKRFDQYAIKRGRHLNPRCRLCGLRFAKANNPNKRTAEDKKQYQKEYYAKNKQKLDTYSNEWRANKRLELIAFAGGKCNCCGESDPIVLDFDHIHNDGAEHRRSERQSNMVTLILRTGFDPNRFQLLCKNCNWRKEYQRRKDDGRNKNASQVSKAA